MNLRRQAYEISCVSVLALYNHCMLFLLCKNDRPFGVFLTLLTFYGTGVKGSDTLLDCIFPVEFAVQAKES